VRIDELTNGIVTLYQSGIPARQAIAAVKEIGNNTDKFVQPDTKNSLKLVPRNPLKCKEV